MVETAWNAPHIVYNFPHAELFRNFATDRKNFQRNTGYSWQYLGIVAFQTFRNYFRVIRKYFLRFREFLRIFENINNWWQWLDRRLEASSVSFFVRWDDWKFIWRLKYGIFGKKNVAVEEPKLHKTDRVNFFLQCVFFSKKIKNQKFWNQKINTVQYSTRRKSAISNRQNLKFCTSAGYNLALLINHRFFTERLSIISFWYKLMRVKIRVFPPFIATKVEGIFG